MTTPATTSAARVVTCTNCARRNRVPAVGTGTPHCGHCHQPLPWIADACDGDFAAVAEASPLPVLVDLWAPWCGPCRTAGPALEQLAQDLAGRVKLVKVNVDAAPALAARFAVRAVPTLLLLRRHDVLARRAGGGPAPALRRWVDEALAGAVSAHAPRRNDG
jgi:thioredoxin 2